MGHSTKFYLGKLRSEVQLLALLYTIFERKGPFLVNLPLTNVPYPFQIPTYEHCIPFNCCNWLVF